MSRTSADPAGPTAPATIPIDRPDARPGWPEVAAGLVALLAVDFGVGVLVARAGFPPAVTAMLLALLSGLAGIAGLAAATVLRRRPLRAFGVRRVSWRWLLAGVGAGLVALVAKAVLTPLFVHLTGAPTDTQAGYAAAAQGGPVLLVLTAVGLAVVTPIGEELFFRGVLTTALLRYGAVVAVGGSAVVFALLHGINVVLPAALVVGLLTGELRRRSGSVWPGVVVHAVNNALTVVVYALIPGVTG